EVPAGAIVAIVGPSGSGKSTLLNMAAGLLMPDRGRVVVMGRATTARADEPGSGGVSGARTFKALPRWPPASLPSAAGHGAWNRAGDMFQEDRLLPWRVAVANVALALEAGTMPAAERRRRAAAALELVGLSAFAQGYPHQLSGGMRSRVALARSLIGEPDLL